MFILPFLKYFKPFRGRLTLAVIGMVLVGMLSTAPILIGTEAFDLLIRYGKVSTSDLDSFGKLSSSVIQSHMKDSPAESKAAALNPHSRAGVGADATNSTLTATGLTGRWLAVKGWYDAKHAQFKAQRQAWRDWYNVRAAKSPVTALGILSALLVVLVLIKGLAEFSSKYQLAYTFFLTNLQIREDLFGNILRQDYLFFNHHSAGYLHSRINNDVKAVRSVLEGLLGDGVQQPITIFFMLILLIHYNPWLTVAVLVFLPLIGGLLYYFARVIRKNMRKQKGKEDQLSSSLTESLNNIRLVKAFGTERLEMGKFHSRSMELFRYIIARRMAKFGSSPLMEWIGTVAFCGVLLLGGWMIFRGMPLSHFLGFLFTLSRFYRPLKSLASVNTKYQEARVSGERMIEILNLQPQLVQCANARPFARLEREIAIEAVCFSYNDKRILHDVSLRVRAGERVAFVGPSGGGKTTLVNMLARLFDPTEGRITIDGVDLRELSLADWRRHLAIVSQDTYLFDDTIENNIAYGISDDPAHPVQPDKAKIEAAARAANAHEFIMQLDGGLGYQTPIGPGGGRLSGGQRQRLAIARAIYRDPKILILDEATSALDAQSQAIVQDALNRLMQGRTTFVIAHRISTISGVDCIYVIDRGHICESGSHEELLAKGGLYHAMVTKVGLVRKRDGEPDDGAEPGEEGDQDACALEEGAPSADRDSVAGLDGLPAPF